MAVAGPRSEPAVVAHSRQGRLPAARGLVPRRPLFDRLSRVGPGEVVLLCAPAGSGKTALLRSWVESEGLADRVAWVSVERGERDAQRFWLSVVDELAGAVAEDGLVERVARHAGLRRRGGRRAAAVRPALAGAARRAGRRRPARAALGGGAPPARALPGRPAAGAAGRARDARGRGARPASAAAGGRADRDPRPRPALLAGGDAPVAGRERAHALRLGIGATLGADRRVGRRPAARRDLAGRTPRSRAVRRRVLRKRAHRGGLPPGGGAGAPAAGRARPAPAHLRARAGQRPARRQR